MASKKFSKKHSFAILSFCVVVFIAIVFDYSFFAFYNAGYDARALYLTISWDLQGIFNGNLFATPTPTPVPVNTPTQILSPTQTPTLAPVVSAEYKSNNLGISFYYATFIPNPRARDGGQRLFVREIGNTVYYYWIAKTNQAFEGNDQQFLSEIAPDSKYIKVFYKNPQQSFTDAIKQHIFGGTIPSQCSILISGHLGVPNVNASYQQAFIMEYITPTTRAYSSIEMRKYITSCTTYASNYDGRSYFIMNPNYSDRFIFIKDWQDDVPSGYKGYMWDGTITIN